MSLLHRCFRFCAESPVVVPLAVAAVALATRLWGIGNKPLWYDEVLTLKRAALPIGELVADSFHNKHFPTYFILIKPFVGEDWSTAILRIPSAVFGAVAALLVARIADLVSGPKAALVAGMLMALSPTEVQYGQEARSYALTSMAILLSLWGLVHLVRNAKQEQSNSCAGRSNFRPWILYAVGTGLAINTLNVALPWFVTANVIYFWLCRNKESRTVEQSRHWQLVNGSVLATWLPGMGFLVAANFGAPERGTSWIEVPTLTAILNTFQTLYTFRISNIATLELLPSAIPGLGAAIVLLAIVGAWNNRRQHVVHIVLVATLTMPCVLLLISLWHPLFVPRYLLWSTGPFFVLAGIGIVSLPRPAQLLSVVCIVGAAAFALLPYYAAETKPRWDLVADYLAISARPPDQFVTSSGLARVVLAAHLHRLKVKNVDVAKSRSLAYIKRHVDAGGTLWLIHGRVGLGKLVKREDFFRSMRAYGRPIERREFGQSIVVWRMVNPSQSD